MRLELGPRFDEGDLGMNRVDAPGAEAVAQILEGQAQLEADPDIGHLGADVAEAGGVVARQPELAILDTEHRVADGARPPRQRVAGAPEILEDEVAVGVEADGVGDERVGQDPARVRRAHHRVLLGRELSGDRRRLRGEHGHECEGRPTTRRMSRQRPWKTVIYAPRVMRGAHCDRRRLVQMKCPNGPA